MRIKIRYFGQFRDITSRHEEYITVKEGITVSEIREHIKNNYPKIAAKSEILVAVNGNFGSLDQVIEEKDEVAFFPPVSGG